MIVSIHLFNVLFVQFVWEETAKQCWTYLCRNKLDWIQYWCGYLYREKERINHFNRIKQIEPETCHLNMKFCANFQYDFGNKSFFQISCETPSTANRISKYFFSTFWVKVRRLEKNRGFIRVTSLQALQRFRRTIAWRIHRVAVNGRLAPLSIYFIFVFGWRWQRFPSNSVLFYLSINLSNYNPQRNSEVISVIRWALS